MTTTHPLETITEIKSGGVDPLHEVTDQWKVAILVRDMAAHGWRGAPIVVAGEQALTGTHRLAAVDVLLCTESVEIPIPRIEIRDLCELYGIDWDVLLDENGDVTYRAAAELRSLLPRDVVEYLGYDVDGA